MAQVALSGGHAPPLPPPPPPPPPPQSIARRLAFVLPCPSGGALGWSAAVRDVACRSAPLSRRSGVDRAARDRTQWCRRGLTVPVVAALPPVKGGGCSGVEAGVTASLPASSPRDTATLALILLNAAVFGACLTGLAPRFFVSLFLQHSCPRWWQLFTSTVCHFDGAHLSGNLFFLLLFGRLVEEEAGPWGLTLVFFVCGAAANVLSLVLLPASTISAGASGAVFGLFVVAVLLRSRWGVRGLVEMAVLGQFVINRLRDEARSALAAPQMVGGVKVTGSTNHVAHLGGALAGVLLLWGVRTFVRAMDRKVGVARKGGEVPPSRR
ncbi:hypothetical protein MMPV_000743 [Pyropia vietnamensis]